MSDEYDFFSIDPGALGDDWKGGSEGQAFRPFETRISNFGALNRGARSSTDYTRTTFDNAIEVNPEAVPGVGFGTDRGFYDYNPFVWGGSIQRTLMDRLHKMGLGGIDIFHVDVSDKKEVNASGMSQYKNYPSEGWNSFGKKYDKQRAWHGNTWIA